MPVRWDQVGTMRVYVGVPDAPHRAGIVIAHHGPGLDGFVQDVVHRLFREGYVVAAPDLYHRQPADMTDTMARIGLLKEDEIVADMSAALAHVEGLDVETLGIVGFCMGGRIAYLMAAASRELAACAVFYGGNIMQGVPSPFDRTGEIDCPMIGFFGNQDANPSPDDVDAIDAELTRLGKPHHFHRYDDAGHAFQNFLNAERYRSPAARDSWTRMLAFFTRHLRA